MTEIQLGSKWRDRSATRGPLVITVDGVDGNSVTGTCVPDAAPSVTAVWVGSVEQFERFERLSAAQ
jgi:hypothetical protein